MHAPRFRCEEDADLWWDDKLDAAKEKDNDMKYKIQIPAAYGWADLKSTEDDGKTYALDLYDTREAAEAELPDMPDTEGRVVPEGTKADCDIY
jgi:hypothetical protein